MNIVDAGYLNDKGEYIEDLMYFSFEPSEKEKRRILDRQHMKEYQEYLEYEQQYYEYDGAA